MLKLLVIEDHALVREGLLQALKSLDTEVVTLGAADAEAIPVLQGDGRMDFPAIEKSAVGTSQVNEVEAAIFFLLDHGVFPRYP